MMPWAIGRTSRQSSGLTAHYTYNTTNALESLVYFLDANGNGAVESGETITAKFIYTHYLDGTKASETDYQGTTAVAAFTWTYDALGRLTQETYTHAADAHFPTLYKRVQAQGCFRMFCEKSTLHISLKNRIFLILAEVRGGIKVCCSTYELRCPALCFQGFRKTRPRGRTSAASILPAKECRIPDVPSSFYARTNHMANHDKNLP
jgi:hypothetical protein